MRVGERGRANWGRVAVLVAVGLALVGLVSMATIPDRDDAGEGVPQHALSLDGRPHPDRRLFDYAGKLQHYEEGVQRFLRRMGERFHVDAIIVTLPALPAGTYLEEVAVDLVDRWRIGGEHERRGLLLLLVEQDKQVKLEVTYELEDVFTDAFTRYVQDLQLRPYYLDGDIGTGLVAVMEELEQRARMKHLHDFTPEIVAKLDEQLLSGGAGARRSLSLYEGGRGFAAVEVDAPSKGARSAKEAWEVMLSKWAGTGADIDVDVYTEMTKLAMGDPDDPDPRTRRSVRHWMSSDYAVRHDGEYAAIWFGNIEGWNNAPFLFCRTPTGWKFDIVHQRRLVVMAQEPSWMIEQGDYPYVPLFEDAPQSIGKDLPLPPEDRYSCDEDAQLAREFRALESARQQSPNDVVVLKALVRLNVITGRRPTHVEPLLARLEKLTPNDPDVHKYAAIYDVHTFFQYETALRKMRTYVKLRPGDAFGHNFIGFLEYRLGNYQASIESLLRAIEIAPDNVYAYSLLSQDYALLHRAAKSDTSRRRYRQQSLAMLQRAANVPTPNAERVARLAAWLDRTLR